MKRKSRIRPLCWVVVIASTLGGWWQGVQSVPTIRNGHSSSSSYSSTSTTTTSTTTSDSFPQSAPQQHDSEKRQEQRPSVSVKAPVTATNPKLVDYYSTLQNSIPTVVSKEKTVLQSNESPQEQRKSADDSFMVWRSQVLGIETSLVIQTFDYYDYMQAHMLQDDDDEFDPDDPFCEFYQSTSNQEKEEIATTVDKLPMLPVRGLAASKNISVGEVVISIPFHALISVPTTIDHDPVLSRILGPEARAKHGWEDAYFEMPLLTVALLYHKHLGSDSPLHHYLELLLTSESGSETNRMPSLWSKRRLRQEATEGIRKIARGIQRDIQEMYQTIVVLVLMEDHPELFGKTEDDWAYSYANFQWAFAMVNSRHWSLPIPDLDLVVVELDKSAASAGKDGDGGDMLKSVPTVNSDRAMPALGEQVPPADQPTENWVNRQKDAENRVDGAANNETRTAGPKSHSFLAPVGDLLNFGPPCTRGQYNNEKKAFELIATCPFATGQEVTYWYSDDCDDTIIANYGFTHPMVPQCPSVEDWREQTEAWRQQSEILEEKLEAAFDELVQLDEEVDELHALIEKCDCNDDDQPRRRKPRAEGSRKQASTKLKQDGHEAGVRGAGGQKGHTDHERQRIRRKWPNKKSDLGL